MTLVFTEAAQAALSGQVVNMSVAVKLELTDETLFLWRGAGSLTTNDGVTWEGLGKFGDISGLDFSPDAATDPITLTLSGLDATLAEYARTQQDTLRGRVVSVYVLMFDSQWQPLDMPYLCQLAVIDLARLKYSNDSFVLELVAEPLFASKHLPSLNLVTDADQQSRYPGDKIFERVAYTHTIFWAQ